MTRSLLALSAALVAASLLLAGCGGGNDPLAGRYALDVEKTLAAAAAKPADGSDLQRLEAEETFSPDTYLLTLRPGGRFVFEVGTGDPFTVEGTWRSSGDAVSLSTTRVEGQRADAADGPGLSDGGVIVDQWLVLAADGRDLYLRRLP
jgi:hypothetical protein